MIKENLSKIYLTFFSTILTYTLLFYWLLPKELKNYNEYLHLYVIFFIINYAICYIFLRVFYNPLKKKNIDVPTKGLYYSAYVGSIYTAFLVIASAFHKVQNDLLSDFNKWFLINLIGLLILFPIMIVVSSIFDYINYKNKITFTTIFFRSIIYHFLCLITSIIIFYVIGTGFGLSSF